MVVELRCEAVLFDLDGALVDSLGVAERILREWAVSRGIDADRACELSHGRRDIDLIPLLAPHLDAEAETGWITAREEHTFDGIVPMPGAARLIAALTTAPSREPWPEGCAPRWAVVTSGTRKVALGRIAAAGLPAPAWLVAAEDVRIGKPDPQPYLRGAELVGVAPDGCVVIEDAMAGVRAATAAGMRCIGVGAGLDPSALTAHVNGLDEVGAAYEGGLIRLSVGGR